MLGNSDLICATLVMVAVCLFSGVAGFVSTRRASRRSRMMILISAVAGFAFYGLFLFDRPIMAELLPVSSLVIVGNWLPIWSSFFVGVYLATAERVAIRQCVLSLTGAVFSVVSIVAPVIGDAPECRGGNANTAFQCQTSPYTCSAACAVTLLRLHGIPANEQEIADLCLTRRGTHWMGLYRALKLKTEGTSWQVVVKPIDLKSGDRLPEGPAILALNFNTSEFPIMLDHGFDHRVGHSVVSLGDVGDSVVDVFDPTPDLGVEQWGKSIWKGTSESFVLTLVSDTASPEIQATIQTRLVAARRASHLALR